MPKVDNNGVEIYYKTKGKGEPVILIGGFTATHHFWNFQKSLSEHFQIITFDNRGVGKSDKPEKDYDMKLMAKDVASIMDDLEIKKAHIVGLSMGGMIAQEFAIRYPNRVNKLVLGCTYAKFGKRLVNSNLRELGILLKFSCVGKSMRQLRKNLRRIFVLSFGSKLMRMLAWFLSSIFLLIFLRGKLMDGFLGQLDASIKHDTLSRLREIKAKTLVIYGEKDRVFKPFSSMMIDTRLPNSETYKIKDGSHLFNIENRKEFNQKLLEFLKEEEETPPRT